MPSPDEVQGILARQRNDKINQAGKGAWEFVPAYGEIAKPMWEFKQEEDKAMQLFDQDPIKRIQEAAKIHDERNNGTAVTKRKAGKKRPIIQLGTQNGGIEKSATKLNNANATRGVIQKNGKAQQQGGHIIKEGGPGDKSKPKRKQGCKETGRKPGVRLKGKGD